MPSHKFHFCIFQYLHYCSDISTAIFPPLQYWYFHSCIFQPCNFDCDDFSTPARLHLCWQQQIVIVWQCVTLCDRCDTCKKTHNQHLLVKCDNCCRYHHLSCLDPPLVRMPKKTKLQGWYVSQHNSNFIIIKEYYLSAIQLEKKLLEHFTEVTIGNDSVTCFHMWHCHIPIVYKKVSFFCTIWRQAVMTMMWRRPADCSRCVQRRRQIHGRRWWHEASMARRALMFTNVLLMSYNYTQCGQPQLHLMWMFGLSSISS